MTVKHSIPETPFIWSLDGPITLFRDSHNEGITLENVAIALAGTVRYRGMTRHFYSVADHCIRGAALIQMLYEKDYDWFMDQINNQGLDSSEGLKLALLAWLLHEVGEVVISDIPAPLKKHLYVNVRQGEVMPLDEWEHGYLRPRIIRELLGEDAYLWGLVHDGDYEESRLWSLVKWVDEVMFILEAEEMVDMPEAVTRGREGYNIVLPEPVEEAREWFRGVSTHPEENVERWLVMVAYFARKLGLDVKGVSTNSDEGETDGSLTEGPTTKMA